MEGNRKQRRETSRAIKRTWKKDPWDWVRLDPEQTAIEIFGDYNREFAFAAANKTYYVLVKLGVWDPFGDMAHVYVIRRDRNPAHSWSDLQRIKNEILGPHYTAVEVYPSQDEVVDDINCYHLWVLPPWCRMPFWIGLSKERPPDVEWSFPGLDGWEEVKRKFESMAAPDAGRGAGGATGA